MTDLGRRGLLSLFGGSALLPTAAGAAAGLASSTVAPATFAAFRAGAWSGRLVDIAGRDRPGDGGGGLFRKQDASGPGVDDGVILLRDAAGAAWRRDFSGGVDLRWAGARGDGVNDDTAAVSRAARSGAIVFATGETLISGRLVLDVFAEVRPGAAIRLAPGAQLIFRAGFRAEIAEVFRGGGQVELDRAHATQGHPEWWGARINDPAFDNAQAIQACLDAAAVTVFMSGDYYYSRELVVSGSNRVVMGVTSNQDGTPGGTRLMLTSATSHGMLLGADAQPGPPTGGWTEHTTIKTLAIKRTVPPVARPLAPGGDLRDAIDAPTGLRVKYAISCFIDDVVCYDHTVGFYSQGVVHTYYRYCQAIRAFGPLKATDSFFGFLQNNGIPVGFASGNASLYYQSCTVVGSQSFAVGVGLCAVGGFTDTSIVGLETALCPTGIRLEGVSPTDGSYSSENLHIAQCILDGCVFNGIVIKAGNQFAAVTITDCYIAQGGGPRSTALQIEATHGAVTIANNQLLSEPGTNSPTGIRVVDSSGVSLRDNILTDFSAPIVFERSSLSRTSDTINNVHQPVLAAAVSFASATRCSAAPIVKGTLGPKGGAGVALDALSSWNEINLSGIDPSALGGGRSSAKLVCGGRPITATGEFENHNLAVGIMG